MAGSRASKEVISLLTSPSLCFALRDSQKIRFTPKPLAALGSRLLQLHRTTPAPCGQRPRGSGARSRFCAHGLRVSRRRGRKRNTSCPQVISFCASHSSQGQFFRSCSQLGTSSQMQAEAGVSEVPGSQAGGGRVGATPFSDSAWWQTGWLGLEAETSLEDLGERKGARLRGEKETGERVPCQPLCRSPRGRWGPAERDGAGGWEGPAGQGVRRAGGPAEGEWVVDPGTGCICPDRAPFLAFTKAP